MDVQESVDAAMASRSTVAVYVLFRRALPVLETIQRYYDAYARMDTSRPGFFARAARAASVYSEALSSFFIPYAHTEIAVSMQDVWRWGLGRGVQSSDNGRSAIFASISIQLNKKGVYIRARDTLENYDVVRLEVQENYACFMFIYAMRLRDCAGPDGCIPQTFYHRPLFGIYMNPQASPPGGWYCHALVAHLLQQAGFFRLIDIWKVDGEILQGALVGVCGGKTLSPIELVETIATLAPIDFQVHVDMGKEMSISESATASYDTVEDVFR